MTNEKTLEQNVIEAAKLLGLADTEAATWGYLYRQQARTIIQYYEHNNPLVPMNDTLEAAYEGILRRMRDEQ